MGGHFFTIPMVEVVCKKEIRIRWAFVCQPSVPVVRFCTVCLHDRKKFLIKSHKMYCTGAHNKAEKKVVFCICFDQEVVGGFIICWMS